MSKYENFPLHSHTKDLNEVKEKYQSRGTLTAEDIVFLFDTIEQLEGELKEWIDLCRKGD